ncbi:MAG TPA: mechanosensitive ion channel domain-containing protein [Streptosporangiaceae bacterium]|jgi:small-conductance mechanosensitive channel|nr:mechanosensitive ion channel domain-containing protein [Streptosporangiaceae bacterium]
MDLQEKRQLDLAGQVARVRAQARPWRAIITLVLAVAAGIVSWTAGSRFSSYAEPGQLPAKVVAAAAGAAACLFGVIAVLEFAGRARDLLQPRTGVAHAAIVRYTIVLLGLLATLIITLALFKLPVSQLLVGGAITSIILGIAAQQALGNVFAGIVLLLSRPFVVGDAVRFRAGSLSGQIEGIVTEIGITYLRLETADGTVHLPNSQVLGAAVGLIQPVPGGPSGPERPSGEGRAGLAPPTGTPPAGPAQPPPPAG